MTHYRALVGLNYPTDRAILRRLAAGEDLPQEARREKRAEPGAVVDDLPVASIPWLLEQGLIEPVEDA